MKKRFAQLERIDHNEPIKKDTHYTFLHHLQSALLLALHEQGTLNVMQYRQAEESLKIQRRNRAKIIQEKGSVHD